MNASAASVVVDVDSTAPHILALRQAMGQYRQSVADAFQKTRRSAVWVRALSRQVDQLLIKLWGLAVGEHRGACLVATGGYGRGELFPGSDVDVLVLVPEGRDPELDQRVRAFLASAWDTGLELAQSVRTLADVAQFAAGDLSGYTSLLDARRIAGDPVQFQRLKTLVFDSNIWPHAEFLIAKLAERSERHARHADTAHNLEPNIKNGRGALRDLQTARWIARRCFAAADWRALTDQGLLESTEATRLRAAESWLSDLRFALHIVSARREERVLFDHQPALATMFGVGENTGRHHAVEALMQRYFRAAADVDRITQSLIERMARRLQGYLDDIESLSGSSVFGLRDDVLEALPSHPGFTTPSSLIEPFVLLARTPAAQSIGPDLAQALARALPALRRSLSADRMAHDYLGDILRTRRPYRALNELHRHGLLGALITPFARVTGRMQYDLFHVFTVDQHTLFLIRNLERFFDANSAESLPLAHELMLRVRQPELLFLAAIFHDIAKGRGGDHSQLGAEDVRRYMKRREYPRADIELVAWLVENHLMMSMTAQKQDTQDPDVVRQFALAVDDWERLECLYLLTVADIRATNPKLWNGWKARLLSDLYQAARFQLRRGIDQPVQRQDRVRATRLRALELLTGEGCMFSAVETIWADFPDQSFWRYTPDQLRWLTHAIVAQGRPDRALVAVRSVGSGGNREIFVRMHDQKDIFATITSMLDRMDLSVIAARVMTTRSGRTLDTFQVIDLRKEEHGTLTRNLEVQMALDMALAEKPLKPRLARRRATREQRLFRFPPQIGFEARSDDVGTQLSLVCPDRPGLLASIAHAFRDADVRVQSARIATFGERAEDFFTVTTDDGHRLDDVAANRLRVALLARVKEGQEVHG